MSDTTPPPDKDGSVDPTLAGRAPKAKSKTGPIIAVVVAVVVVAAAAFGIYKAVGGKKDDANITSGLSASATSDTATTTDTVTTTETTAAADEATDAETVEAAGPVSGTDDAATVVIGLSLEPTNLDVRNAADAALTQAFLDNVYEGLVSRGADGNPVPKLASEWTISDDALTYTFTIPDGRAFSNGDALTADDVAWSLNDVIDNGYVGADTLAKVASVEAADANTLVITLSEPYPDLLWALGGRGGLVLDQDATNDLSSSAIGSGPFLFQEWKQGDSITLVRNDNYWGTPAGVQSVVLRYITDSNAQLNAFNAGDVDVLAPISNDLVSQIAVDGAETFVAEASDKFVLAFNNAAEPLNQLEVRQAIRYAIDHPAVVTARGGVDRELGGPIAPTDPGYEDLTSLYPHDVDKAKELLAAAGYADGLELTLTIPSFYGNVLPDVLTSQLAEAGITLTVESVEFAAWLEDVYTNHDYQLSIVDHAEARDFGNWANPDYYFGYDNAEVQSLYAQAIVAASAEEEAELLAQAARIVSEEAAADWLVNFRQSIAVWPGISGFPQSQINSYLPLAGLAVAAQ
ncbi:MAG: ABC transporter substrate-binding protein [Bifidobacteriaceae bacterium]|jgi:peptide/nickel transport system substrate-binding protein|nr:ABC transporter substrate-binding protein [Bifidobacteriaceae bacterium]